MKILFTFLVLVAWSGFLFSEPSRAYSTSDIYNEADTATADLTEKQRNDLIKSIHAKVKRLEEYITLIASKRISSNAMDEKIRQSVDMFLSEKNYVQMIGRDKNGNEIHKQRYVRDYFTRLASIAATKVDITFYEVAKLTKLLPGDEPNTYHTTAYIYQDTKIYRGNDVKVDYYDRTIKQVDITVKINFQTIGDQTNEEYVTKLGNIHVKELK